MVPEGIIDHLLRLLRPSSPEQTKSPSVTLVVYEKLLWGVVCWLGLPTGRPASASPFLKPYSCHKLRLFSHDDVRGCRLQVSSYLDSSEIGCSRCLWWLAVPRNPQSDSIITPIVKNADMNKISLWLSTYPLVDTFVWVVSLSSLSLSPPFTSHKGQTMALPA
jgi:hypothetical protein